MPHSLFLLNKRQVRPLAWQPFWIFGFSLLKGKLSTKVFLFWIFHYSLFPFPTKSLSVISSNREYQNSLLMKKTSKIKFAQVLFEWFTEQLAVPKFDLNNLFFFLMKKFLKVLNQGLLYSWNWLMVLLGFWVNAVAFIFQQYLIGTQELHIFLFSPQVNCEWQEEGTFLLGLCFSSDEFFSAPLTVCLLRGAGWVGYSVRVFFFYCICSSNFFEFSYYSTFWGENQWK